MRLLMNIVTVSHLKLRMYFVACILSNHNVLHPYSLRCNLDSKFQRRSTTIITFYLNMLLKNWGRKDQKLTCSLCVCMTLFNRQIHTTLSSIASDMICCYCQLHITAPKKHIHAIPLVWHHLNQHQSCRHERNISNWVSKVLIRCKFWSRPTD